MNFETDGRRPQASSHFNRTNKRLTSSQDERERVYRDCYDRMTEAKGTREEIANRQEQTPTLEFVERDQREVSLGRKSYEGEAEGDCSIRAISTLTGADYHVVAQECTTARNDLLSDTERVEDEGIPFLALPRIHRRTPMDGVRTAEGGG